MDTGRIGRSICVFGAAAALACNVMPETHLESGVEQVAQAPLTAAASIPMEMAVLPSVSGSWTTVNLARQYQSMVVVATPAYTESTVPLVVRVRNALDNHFDINVSRFDGRSGSVSPVSVAYLVMEEGAYNTAQHGWTIEAKRFSSTVTDRAGRWNGQVQTTTNQYVSPVVLGQVMTANDSRPSVFWSRGASAGDPASASSLRVGKHIGEDTVTTRKNEVLGYIVAEATSMKFANLLVQASVGADTVRGIPGGAVRYPLTYPGTGVVALLSQSGMDDNDGSWAVLYGAGAASGSDLLLAVDEDNVRDSERNHGTEQVAYLAFTPRPECPVGGCDPSECVPGSLALGVIDGSVELGKTHSVADLQGIWCITGDLRVSESTFSDLTGLEALTAVHGGVVVYDNPALGTLAGLEHLRSTATLEIENNPQLVSLAGLSDLTSLQAVGPAISGNPMLPACWVWQLVRQTGTSCIAPYCGNNTGAGSCGTLPDGFVCQPGASGPGVLDGSLLVDSSYASNQYGGVTCVTGDLSVSGTSQTDLSGLETLVAVGRSVYIDSNASLMTLRGLDHLRTVGGGLRVQGNPSLTTLTGLGSLVSVQGDVSIFNDPLLSTLQGLEQLTSAASLTIADNAALTSLAGLGSLDTLAISPRISNNPQLPACWTWQIAQQTSLQCEYCTNNTGSGSCGTLPEGFVCQPGATGPGVYDGWVNLSDPSSLSQLGGVTCITHDLNVLNSNLTDLSGLDHLVAVGGNLYVSDNPALTTLHGLEALKSVNRLVITNNAALTDLAALGSLTTLSQSPAVANNAQLPACWSWQIAQQTSTRCDYCSANTGSGSCGTLPEGFVCQPGATGPGVYDGWVELRDPSDLSRLGGVTCITGDLNVRYSNLTDLSGLTHLVAVGGNVSLLDNPALTSLHGLEALKSANGLEIRNNSSLGSLAALANLTTLNISPSIAMNRQLPACWSWQIAQQTSTRCEYCGDNTGNGSCGTLPEGFVCQPGATGPGVYEGSVDLRDPMALSQLGGVTCITGDLNVRYSNLTDLSGLEHLVAVGGFVSVTDNPALTTLHGLEALKSASVLEIRNNPVLGSLAELSNLKNLLRNPSIVMNPQLPACWSWQIAQQTSTRCEYCGDNTGNGSCGTLPEGFVCQPGAIGPGVYDGWVELWDPNAISRYGGVTCITGDLNVRYTNLTDLSGLDYLVAVGGFVSVSDNPALTTLHGLEALKSASGLEIRNNPVLGSLAELSNLKNLLRNPSIVMNPQLPACWSWQIAQQTSTRCEYCGGNAGNGSCGTLPEGFVCQPGATGPGVYDGSIILDGWTRIDQFGGVTCITGDINVRFTNLTDLSGLDYLELVGGSIAIDGNSTLLKLQGLDHLKSASGLYITNNASLTSLANLSNLTNLGYDPYISNNPLLPQCWAESVAARTGRTCGCWNNGGIASCQ